MVPSMALTAHATHVATLERAGPYGPLPSRRSALDYVQVPDPGGSIVARPARGGGLTVGPPVASRADFSWPAPPEPMGT
jgi:hypothetical protein